MMMFGIMLVTPMIFAQVIAAQTITHTSPPTGYGQPTPQLWLFSKWWYKCRQCRIGFTSAAQRVDAIGVTVTLQRWTGDSWTNVYTSPSRELSSASYDYREYKVGVQTGYYYRSIPRHSGKRMKSSAALSLQLQSQTDPW